MSTQSDVLEFWLSVHSPDSNCPKEVRASYTADGFVDVHTSEDECIFRLTPEHAAILSVQLRDAVEKGLWSIRLSLSAEVEG